MSSYLTLPSGKPNPYSPQPAKPASPWGSIDASKPLQGQYSGTVDQAWQGLNYAAQQGWGKTLSDQDKQRLAGASGYQGGAVNQDHYNKALTELDSMYGPRQSQVDPNASPRQPEPQLGPENATQQWQKQAPAAGVPQSFRGINPYYAQQQSSMSRILANPQTMDQQWQDQQNEQQKESAQRMMQQGNTQAGQMMAGRGFGANGGTQQAVQNQNQQQMMSQILSGRRDTAQKAVTQNRQDEYNALDASQQLAGQEWDATMGLSAQNLNQMNQNRQGNLQDFLGLHGADLDTLKFGESKSQFNKNYGLDFLRYLAQKDQFGQTLGENQRQFNGQQGFNWASLNAQQQQQLMATILGAF